MYKRGTMEAVKSNNEGGEEAGAVATMTKEEKKFMIRSLWDSLVDVQWTKDDLIDFGKAIFSKQSLQKMEEKTFTKIFPFLNKVAENLGAKMSAEANKVEDAPQPKEETKDGEEVAEKRPPEAGTTAE